MSEIIWESEDGTLALSRYVGPAGPPDRRRWQFTTFTAGGTANLGRTDAEGLCAALLSDLKDSHGS